MSIATRPMNQAVRPAAVPCVKCGTTGGRGKGPYGKPYRMDGAKHGYEGKMCDPCYRTLECRMYAAKRKQPPLVPCAKCKTPEGRISLKNKTGRPGRRRADRYGLADWVCLDCYDEFNRIDRSEIGYDYEPDEAEIRRGREAIRASVESDARAATKNDKAVARMRANAERAKVERARALGERLAGMGRACVLARG